MEPSSTKQTCSARGSRFGYTDRASNGTGDRPSTASGRRHDNPGKVTEPLLIGRTVGSIPPSAPACAGAFPSDLGDPTDPSGPRYALCVRDGTRLLYTALALPGDRCLSGTCWRALPGLGFRYRGPSHAAGAIKSLKVVAGPNSQVRASANGSLAGLLPVTEPLVVQLESDTGACWSTTFVGAQVLVNKPALVRAKQ